MQKQQGIKRFSHFHGLALTSRLSIQPLPSTSMWFFYRFMYLLQISLLALPETISGMNKAICESYYQQSTHLHLPAFPLHTFQLVKISLKVWHLQEWLPFNILLPWSYSKSPSSDFLPHQIPRSLSQKQTSEWCRNHKNWMLKCCQMIYSWLQNSYTKWI